jgi:hypothetical protein
LHICKKTVKEKSNEIERNNKLGKKTKKQKNKRDIFARLAQKSTRNPPPTLTNKYSLLHLLLLRNVSQDPYHFFPSDKAVSFPERLYLILYPPSLCDTHLSSTQGSLSFSKRGCQSQTPCQPVSKLAPASRDTVTTQSLHSVCVQ